MDRAALVALYNATDGNSWSDNTNWLSDRPLGEWYGVTTDNPGGRVIALALPNYDLKGQLPPEFGQLTALDTLEINYTQTFISDLTALSDHPNLRALILVGNRISDLSALSDLPRLEFLDLTDNGISDISPLLGLKRLTFLGAGRNPLSAQSINTHIPSLEARGVSVNQCNYCRGGTDENGFTSVDGEITGQDEPQIYNDNLFIMPKEGKYHADLTASFYQHFDDEFDFLMFVTIDRLVLDNPGGAYYTAVKNDVQGIDRHIFSDSSTYGSAGKLPGNTNVLGLVGNSA